MPWLDICGGMVQTGRANDRFSVRTMNFSLVTGALSGAPLSFQSGISSSRARGSSTAPESMWAPTSEPFSSTQTLTSWPRSALSWRKRIAADRPDGPAPTMTTS